PTPPSVTPTNCAGWVLACTTTAPSWTSSPAARRSSGHARQRFAPPPLVDRRRQSLHHRPDPPVVRRRQSLPHRPHPPTEPPPHLPAPPRAARRPSPPPPPRPLTYRRPHAPPPFVCPR